MIAESMNLENVVVVHGFAGKRMWMLPLCARLRRHFAVTNWGYNSFAGSIERHGDNLHRFLEKIATDDRPIHLVAHSMGSIIVRSAIKNQDIPNLKRIVLLAPPNRGAPVAKIAATAIGWACTPIKQLSSETNSFVNRLPKQIPYAAGVIAAKYDILVPVENTKLPGTQSHAVLTATHNTLLLSKAAGEMTINFLRFGCFEMP